MDVYRKMNEGVHTDITTFMQKFVTLSHQIFCAHQYGTFGWLDPYTLYI